MRSFLVVLAYIYVATAAGLSASSSDQVSEGFEQLRETLLSLPDDVFALELAVLGLGTSEDVEEDISGFRDKFATRIFAFVEQLYEIELSIYKAEEENGTEEEEPSCLGSWSLGMNLNPSDNHTMDYTTGWRNNETIGTETEALSKDYLNITVWNTPADYIAIVRHQDGIVDAVKVFQFVESRYSLNERFNSGDDHFFRSTVTEGGPIQANVADDATYMQDDPVFSVDGDLVFNWGYGRSSDGTWPAHAESVRIALTGGHLSEETSNDHDTRGIGGNFACNPVTSVSGGSYWEYEISVIQDCPFTSSCWNSNNYKVMGTDHGTGNAFNSVAVYGQYAIYVSPDATTFPRPGSQLGTQMPCP